MAYTTFSITHTHTHTHTHTYIYIDRYICYPMFVFIRSCLQLDVSVNVPLQCSPIPNRLTPK